MKKSTNLSSLFVIKRYVIIRYIGRLRESFIFYFLKLKYAFYLLFILNYTCGKFTRIYHEVPLSRWVTINM